MHKFTKIDAIVPALVVLVSVLIQFFATEMGLIYAIFKYILDVMIVIPACFGLKNMFQKEKL